MKALGLGVDMRQPGKLPLILNITVLSTESECSKQCENDGAIPVEDVDEGAGCPPEVD